MRERSISYWESLHLQVVHSPEDPAGDRRSAELRRTGGLSGDARGETANEEKADACLLHRRNRSFETTGTESHKA